MLSFDTDGDFTNNYKFLIGSILPRPIAFVSTLNEDGSNNLAPFSFFTAISAKPMIVAFSPLIRSSTGKMKDTPINILKNGEFVINIVSEQIANQVNLCASELAYGEDEFLKSKLTAIDSEIVKPKRVKESLVHFECKFRDNLSYGDGIGAGQIITGEVVKVHVAEEIYQEGRILTDKLNPLGRGAGNDWIKCNDRIQLERLTAQIQK
ncbi:MAG: flavin reductase family protein [Halobacteriovoraceae bacterium]|jgi:flavin reductase (DIM6/NTAB) family NADH-FMN oxidoreductase RutF|nr:flavin reductase family protein [Halobacteriovoraceae bacterium]